MAARIPKAKVIKLHADLDSCLATWQSTVRLWAVASGVSEHDRDLLTNALHTAVTFAAALRADVERKEGRG